jgi:hypothetical protein
MTASTASETVVIAATILRPAKVLVTPDAAMTPDREGCPPEAKKGPEREWRLREGLVYTPTMRCFASAADGHQRDMTDHIQRDEEIEVEVELEDTDDEQGDRAPQPGNTPAPGEPPLDSGAITGGDLADEN